MTQDELDRLEALANAATPGPWVVNGGVPEQVVHSPTKRHPNRTSFMPIVWLQQTDYASGEYVADMMDGDAQFIAAARDAVPALVAEVKRLRGLVEAAYREGWKTGTWSAEDTAELNESAENADWQYSQCRKALDYTEEA